MEVVQLEVDWSCEVAVLGMRDVRLDHFKPFGFVWKDG